MPNQTYGKSVIVIEYEAADLRAWRAVERLTQIEASKLLKCAPRTYQNWENGVTPLPKGFAERFQLAIDYTTAAKDGALYIPRDPRQARLDARAANHVPGLRDELADDWYSQLGYHDPRAATWPDYLAYRRQFYLNKPEKLRAIDLLAAKPEAQWPAWPTNEQMAASMKRHTK